MFDTFRGMIFLLWTYWISCL